MLKALQSCLETLKIPPTSSMHDPGADPGISRELQVPARWVWPAPTGVVTRTEAVLNRGVEGTGGSICTGASQGCAPECDSVQTEP